MKAHDGLPNSTSFSQQLAHYCASDYTTKSCVPPVEEVEGSFMVENSLYFLDPGSKLSETSTVVGLLPRQPRSPKRQILSPSEANVNVNKTGEFARAIVNSKRHKNSEKWQTPNVETLKKISREEKENIKQDSCDVSNVSCEKDTWNCKRCTFINLKDLEYCEVCDTPRNPNIDCHKGTTFLENKKWDGMTHC